MEGPSSPPSLARSGAHLPLAGKMSNSLTRSLMVSFSLAYVAAGHKVHDRNLHHNANKVPSICHAQKKGPHNLRIAAPGSVLQRRLQVPPAAPPHEEPEMGRLVVARCKTTPT